MKTQIKEELELIERLISYCKECIEANTETWIIKEYKAVLLGYETKKIELIERLINKK